MSASDRARWAMIRENEAVRQLALPEGEDRLDLPSVEAAPVDDPFEYTPGADAHDDSYLWEDLPPVVKLTEDDLSKLFTSKAMTQKVSIGNYPSPLGPVYGFQTGEAGSGKTYSIKQAIANAKDPRQIILCATTGAAAVNLGPSVTTVNSVFKYSTTENLEMKFHDGSLAAQIKYLYNNGVRIVVIDEISMMGRRQFVCLHAAVGKFNEYLIAQGLEPFHVHFVGDFCQLPPVNDDFVFQSPTAWAPYAANMNVLRGSKRQSNETFLKAINAAREGRGDDCVAALEACGVMYAMDTRADFLGTTLMATNKKCDFYNEARMRALPGDLLEIPSYRWIDNGRGPESYGPSEWKTIPEKLQFKIGALMMVTANVKSPKGQLLAANGDKGIVTAIRQTDWDINERTGEPDHQWIKANQTGGAGAPPGITIAVDLTIIRQGKEAGQVTIRPISRDLYAPATPEAIKAKGDPVAWKKANAQYKWGKISWDTTVRKYLTGQCMYIPLTPGWATSIHKSQGQTLREVQVDIRDGFFGKPAMAYVAISRCQTPEGLSLIGDPGTLARRVCIDPVVKPWI